MTVDFDETIKRTRVKQKVADWGIKGRQSCGVKRERKQLNSTLRAGPRFPAPPEAPGVSRKIRKSLYKTRESARRFHNPVDGFDSLMTREIALNVWLFA